MSMDIKSTIVNQLKYIGEDISREGLLGTPTRVVASWGTLYSGYKSDISKILEVTFNEDCDEMVVLRDIEMYSTCEHHLLPFWGKAHIAYIPNNKIVGVSKLARVLECYSRRLQIQERICKQVVEALDKYLSPLGSACIIEAQHFCMTSRGVEKQKSKMVTSSLSGVFKTEASAREELLELIKM